MGEYVQLRHMSDNKILKLTSAVVLYGVLVAVRGDCPVLSVPAHMKVPITTGFNSDPPIEISCRKGFKLDTDKLSKWIQCIAIGPSDMWNDTLGQCVRKTCRSDSLSTNYETPTLPLVEVDNTYNVTCAEGYAFSLNPDAVELAERTVITATIECVDNGGTVYGDWDMGGMTSECQIINCTEPLSTSGAKLSLTTGTLHYLSEAVYTCFAGHYIPFNNRGGLYALTIVCNKYGLWDTVEIENKNIGPILCKAEMLFIGCLDSEDVTPVLNSTIEIEYSNVTTDTNVTTTTNSSSNGTRTTIIDACVETCRSFTTVAAVQGNICYCGDLATTSFGRRSCEYPCPDYDSKTKDSPAYCGGNDTDGQRYSVYSTVQGCYSTAETNFTDPNAEFLHYGDTVRTCVEICRQKGSEYGAYTQALCTCNDTKVQDIFNDGEFKSSKKCDTDIDVMVFQVAKYELATTCDKLFQGSFIRTHGTYMLETGSQMCYFKDGTQCDQGWIGKSGYCYYFHRRSVNRILEEARQLCREQDAEILTITSSDEMEFVRQVIWATGFQEIGGFSEDWWLGLVDSDWSSVFTWLDGTLLTYNVFPEKQPDGLHQCVGGREGFDTVTTADCNEQMRVTCKKRQGNMDSCVNLTDSVATPLNLTDMSLTVCVQTCKGQEDMTYALIQDTICICANNSVGVPVNKSQCDMPCPGNLFQLCGGQGSDIYSNIKVSDLVPAKSCSELQMFGMGSGNYMVEDDNGVEQIQYCDINYKRCPLSFFSVADSCYKVIPYETTNQAALDICSRDDAYSVVIETDDEVINISNALRVIGLYSRLSSFGLGLSATSVNYGRYRWANGRRNSVSMWDANATAGFLPDVLLNTSDIENWVEWNEMSNHICEKGGEYIGCFNFTGSFLIESYDYMTIQLCVEICRANGTTKALVGGSSCACSNDSLPETYGKCNQTCSGQSNQVCGGDGGLVSVYSVDSYPMYSSCQELYDNGIFLSHNYMIDGEGIHKCQFIDNSGNCDDDWISYNGNCYRHFRAETVTRYAVCDAVDATQTSLLSVDEYLTLLEYVQNIDFGGMFYQPYSGVSDANYDLDLFVNQDGKLMDWGLKTSGYLEVNELHYGERVLSFLHPNKTYYTDLALTGQDGGVICKKETSVLGCYETNTTADVSLVLQDYASVDLTQCKQLCIAMDRNVTLIGNRMCACADQSVLETATIGSPASCNATCSGKSYQKCGDETVVWAHISRERDDPVATNCTDLYSSGVFYNSSYLLYNTATATYEHQQCGFSDDTVCDSTWLGNNGNCFKFVKPRDKHSAVKKCFSWNSFLFNPIQSDTVNVFVDKFIQESGVINTDFTDWRTGIYNILYNVSYVASDGRLIRTDFTQSPNYPTSDTAYSNGRWKKGDFVGKSPYVCQKHDDYLGCYETSSMAPHVGETLSDLNTNSLTFCLQWCQGKQFTFAAVSDIDTCQCSNTIPSAKAPYPIQCLKKCANNPTQSCGGNGYATVVAISNQTGLGRDCNELFHFGITKPGIYKTRWNDSSPILYLTCFDFPDPLAMFSRNESIIESRSGPPVYGGLIFSMREVLFSFPLDHAWRPLTEEGSFVQLDLIDSYLITGILLTGRFTEVERSHIVEYELKYLDPVTSQRMYYKHHDMTNISSGCDFDVEVPLCYNFLWSPFVTRSVSIHPVSWKTRVSMKVALLGQLFSDFNENEKYMGCCPDFEGSFQWHGDNATLDSCITVCRNIQMPFASLNSNNECLCGSGCVSSGFVPDDVCPSYLGDRIGTDLYRAVYRTYEKLCSADPPQLDLGHIVNYTYTYQDGVNTYGTSILYECDLGWEPVQPSVPLEVHCNDANEWTNITVDMECQEIRCPILDVMNGVVVGTNEVSTVFFDTTLTVVCDDMYWADNHKTSMNITCQLDKTWTSYPRCLGSNYKHVQRYQQLSKYVRTDTDQVVEEMFVRSLTDCALLCQKKMFCMFANYHKVSSGRGLCRFYEDVADSNNLQFDPEWWYLQMTSEVDF